MKKPRRILKVFVSSLCLYFFRLNSIAYAQDVYGEPMRIRDAESIFINVIIALWALSIPYFIFVIISIGAQWMLSAGDEQKLASLKTKGKNVIFSFALVFGGYLVVRLVMSLLGLQDPSGSNCFTSPMGNFAMFKFFFPSVCTH